MWHELDLKVQRVFWVWLPVYLELMEDLHHSELVEMVLEQALKLCGGHLKRPAWRAK